MQYTKYKKTENLKMPVTACAGCRLTCNYCVVFHERFCQLCKSGCVIPCPGLVLLELRPSTSYFLFPVHWRLGLVWL